MLYKPAAMWKCYTYKELFPVEVCILDYASMPLPLMDYIETFPPQ